MKNKNVYTFKICNISDFGSLLVLFPKHNISFSLKVTYRDEKALKKKTGRKIRKFKFWNFDTFMITYAFLWS